METIKFKLLHPDAKLPVRAHPTDACFDVVATSRQIKEGYIHYGLGFATEAPEGWEGKIFPRSSISEYDLVMCNDPEAKMDAHYRGEWRVRFKYIPKMLLGSWTGHTTDDAINLTFYEPGTDYAKIYQVGDRIGQIQFRKLDVYGLVLVDELSDTPRGTGGFGSTGA